MKKILILLFVVITTTVVAGCNRTLDTKPAFEKPEDVYAFSAISATQLLDQEMQTIKTSTNNTSPTLKLSTTNEALLVENQVDELNKYLNMIEMILGNDNGLGVTKTNSDLSEYEHKLIFSTQNLLGEAIIYEIYYNEHIEDQDEDDFDEDDYEALIEGVIIVDGVEYQLVGSKEYDEGELEITLKSILDDDNYVEVYYELEENESKFEFAVTVNGEVVQYTELKIEIEDDEIEIELDFLYNNIEGSYEFELEFEDEYTYIKIEYELTDEFGNEEEGEIRIRIIVDEETDQTYYEYQIKTDKSSTTRDFTKERSEK